MTIQKNKIARNLATLRQINKYSQEDVAEQIGVSRQAVWKAINTLKSQGYVFDSITRKGYKLVAYPEHLNTYAVKSHLNTNLIGKNLIVLDSVTSTNDYSDLKRTDKRQGQTWQSMADKER